MIYFSKVKENLPGNTKMIEIDTNLGNLFLLREANKKPPKCIFFSFRDPISEPEINIMIHYVLVTRPTIHEVCMDSLGYIFDE